MIYPKSIAAFIEQFQKFPSVCPKSAQRMAFQVLKMPVSEVESLQTQYLMPNAVQKPVKFVLIFQHRARAKSANQQTATAL